MGQSPDHQATHRRVHHRFTGLAYPFVVLTQAAVLPEPGKSPLHDSPSRQHGEGGTGGRLDIRRHEDPARGWLHHLGRPAQVLLDPITAFIFAVVGGIQPDMGEVGELDLDVFRGY